MTFRAIRIVGALWPPVLVAVTGLLGWSLLSNYAYANQAYLFPAPHDVIAAAVANKEILGWATLMTLVEAAAGFVVAAVMGIAAAGLMSQFELLRRGFYPYAVLLQTIPTIVVAPIIVLWFGYTIGSVILISAMLSFAPIINNTLAGLLATSPNLVDLFRLHRASRWKTFWQLRLPAALPAIIAGLKTSAGLSVVGAIVGEFVIGSVGAHGGLGVQIIFAQGRLNTALLFAEVIAASLLGLSFFQSISRAGHLLLKNWHEAV